MKNVRIKNNGSQTIRLTGHRELKPGDERSVPETDALLFAATPRDADGKGVDVVEKAEPHSKSEARRLAAQRGK